MAPWQLLILALIGCLTGFINVMAGGGSLLTMPVMVLMGMKGPVANGTNRVAILAQNITAVAGFFRQGFSDFKLSLTLSLCALPGAVIGAWFGTKLQGVWFNRTLAAVMMVVMILMSMKKPKSAEDRTDKPLQPKRLIAAHILMVAAGFYGGFIQAGVGFIMMTILHRILGLDLVRVNMHKVFIVGIYTIAALAIFAIRGNVVWLPGCCLAAGNAIGGWFGSHIAVKKGERLIKIVFNTALIVLAIKLLLK